VLWPCIASPACYVLEAIDTVTGQKQSRTKT
jgi:hypothetical protein